MRTSHQLRVIILLMLAIAIARPALAQRTTTSGEFVTEPPTLVSLGFEWRIAGDDNRNATVDVSFRKKSEPSWRPAELSARTFCTFAREFSSISGKGRPRENDADPDTVLPVYSSDRAIRSSEAVAPDEWARGTRGRKAVRPGHAAASTDGHVAHDADRLASPRVRRAAAARAVRSVGTASPVPKYISSGVCPRNAECGRTRLCSST
jgi:hypothetical protein